MKKNLYILFILLSLVAFSSCEEESFTTTFDKSELKEEVEEGYADLTISFNTPALEISSSRTIAYDPKNDKGSWSTWEKFVDGALLYHVTIFVIEDTSGKLVAYRHFYIGSPDIQADDPTTGKGGNGFYEGYTENALWSGSINTDAKTGVAVKATFKASNPLHGNIEMLQPGDYTIIAVANYSPIVASGTNGRLNSTLGITETYDGLGNVAEDGTAETNIINKNGIGGDFTALVNAITSDVTTDGNFAGVDNALSNAVFSYQLNSGEDRVCKQLPQPLVMIRKKTLVAGNNQLEGQLSRTFARVRVEVKNNDKQANLGVSNFQFNGSYASRRAYLFNDVAAGTVSEGINFYDHFSLFGTVNDDDGTITGGTAGVIGVDSDDAIIKASDKMTTLTVDTKIEMFDGYILEGKVKNKFAFSFTGTYWGEGNGANATKELFIRSFNVGDKTGGNTGSTIESTPGNGYDRAYGMLEYFVFIRSEATSQSFGGGGGNGNNQQSSSTSNYIFKSATLSGEQTETNLTVANPNGTGDIELGETYIGPEYIWKIELTSLPTYSSTNGEKGYATGTLRCIGTGLYLQALTAEDLADNDMTPKLGVSPSEVSFKIDFNPQYETGTIFCKVGDDWYYIDCDGTTVSWKKIGTTAPSSSSNETYKYLTFETIGGTEGTQTNVTVENYVINKEGEIDNDNIIVRNDFYYAIIPISYSESSANSSTTTSGESSE